MLLTFLIITWISATLQDCIERERDPTGSEYRGFNVKSATGHKCKLWGYNHQSFPLAGLQSNFCRNPGSADSVPWCYTDGPYGWSRCNIPDCEALECVLEDIDNQGLRYRGSQNKDKDGQPCLDWTETKHHPAKITDAGLEDGNFCRNPGTTPERRGAQKWFRSRPWCYVTKTKIGYCDVPYCEEEGTEEDKDDYSLSVGCIPYDEDPRGQKYRGHLQRTKSFKMCEPWNIVHQIAFPYDDVIQGVRSCRNPLGNSTAPWCYTESDGKWEFCDVPACVERDLVCGDNEVICNAMFQQCVPEGSFCDGVNDCDDYADELFCGTGTTDSFSTTSTATPSS